MTKIYDVVIIGAGPYGLSLAAHLQASRLNFRIFGSPMNTWRTQMPSGMFLKSEGFASDLYEPGGTFRLADYCAQHGIEYRDIGVPVARQTFAAYGLAFQKKFVPMLEDKTVTALDRVPSGFVLDFADGETVMARRVVVAVGISYFQHIPLELAHLPETFLSHSSGHQTFEKFKDRHVTVIGAGSSALDVTALLLEAGVTTQLVTRRSKLNFQEPPEQKPRSLLERLRAPRSGLGTGWRSRLCTDMPLVFHRMPQSFRINVVKTHLGPAPCWFTKEQVEGKVPVQLGMKVKTAEVRQDRVHLRLSGPDGKDHELETDHIIAGTGYRVDLGRIPFLSRELRSQIRSVNDTPVLSTKFESSIPGLHFVGASSANSFGPLVRFAYGARFTARRMSRHLEATR